MRSQLQIKPCSVKRVQNRRCITIGALLFSLMLGIDRPQATAAPAQQDAQLAAPAAKVDRSTRAINEVTIPATHNSYNYAPKFQLPNVNESVTEQLQNGVRGLELDPNYLGKEIQLFHGVGGVLGTQPAAEVLTEVLKFVRQNPAEIVVLKMHSKVPGPELASLVERVGLFPYLYAHQKGAPIPTYAELTSTNRRVLTTNVSGKLSSRLRLCTTRWNLKSPEALWPPREHRAPCKGDFFSVIAFAVDPALGTGSPENASVINDYEYLLNFTETAWKLNGKKVWRIEVDFPDIGNVYKVADTLNRWNLLKGEVRHQNAILPEVSWKCQYSMGEKDIETTTYGRFAFPMKPNEKVTLTPSHPDFVFSPASVTFTNADGKDRVKNFTATRR